MNCDPKDKRAHRRRLHIDCRLIVAIQKAATHEDRDHNPSDHIRRQIDSDGFMRPPIT
jgi:hypothetical protein